MNRHAGLLTLVVSSALVAACAADRTTEPRRDPRQPGGSHILLSCENDPSQAGCDGNVSTSPAPDTTLIPLCSAAAGGYAGSATPISDTSIAVRIQGPLYVRSCRGAAAWYAFTTGNVGGAHYRWYYSACTGLYNWCGAPYSLVREGDNLTTLSMTLAPDVRAVWVYVEVKDLAGKYLTGVSSSLFTHGPAWGPDGGRAFDQPCFVPDYPFPVMVDNGFTLEFPGVTLTFPQGNPQYYWYSRN
jgi:hypothetical protein